MALINNSRVYTTDVSGEKAVRTVKGKALSNALDLINSQGILDGETYDGSQYQLFSDDFEIVHFFLKGVEQFQVVIGTNSDGDIWFSKLSPATNLTALYLNPNQIFQNQPIGTRLGIINALGDESVVFSIVYDPDDAFEITDDYILSNTRLLDIGDYQVGIKAVGINSEILELFDLSVNEAGPITNINLSSLTVTVDAPVDKLVGVLSINGGAPPATFTLIANPGGIFKIVNDNELRVASAPVGSVDDIITIGITATDLNGTERTETFGILVVLADFVNERSYSFNGSDEHLEAPHDSTLWMNDKFSAWAWIKVPALGGERTIMSKFGAAGARGWRWFLNASGVPTLNISQNGSASLTYVADTAVVVDTWYLAVVSFDGNAQEIKMWLNETSVYDDATTYTAIYNNTTVPFRIGARGDSSFPETAYFIGNIDETMLVNEPATQLDIESVYNAGAPTDVDSTLVAADIISSWRMGDNFSGGEDPDEHGANDLELVNMSNSNRDTDVP